MIIASASQFQVYLLLGQRLLSMWTFVWSSNTHPAAAEPRCDGHSPVQIMEFVWNVLDFFHSRNLDGSRHLNGYHGSYLQNKNQFDGL